MLKKVSLLGFCILGLLPLAWSQVGPASIEFLAFGSTGASIPWEFQPPNPAAKVNFNSPVLFTLEVPPSPKSQGVFLEIWGQYIFSWTNNPVRFLSKLVFFKIVSPKLPNIEFSQAYGICPGAAETNNALDYSFPPENRLVRHKGYTKLGLMRGSLEWWWIVDTNTGQRPTDEEALSYLNKIIDDGFKVEVWAGGTVQGLSYIAPFGFQLEATRIGPPKDK